MERVKQRMGTAQAALASLREVLDAQSEVGRDAPDSLARLRERAIQRDAAILRFQYTFEAVWKAAKAYLMAIEGVDVASPKAVIRQCRLAGLLEETDAALAMDMADARNLTAHTYNEAIACDILARTQRYAPLMDRWLAALDDGLRGLGPQTNNTEHA